MIKDVDLSRSQWEHLIDEWIFDELDRKILKRRLLDGVLFKTLSEEFNISETWVKKRVSRCLNKISKHI